MLYLKPEYKTDSGEIFNVVSIKGKKMGYLLYMYKEKGELYVVGHLDDIGEKQNYIDIVKLFVEGLKAAIGVENDPLVRVCCGGEVINLDDEE